MVNKYLPFLSIMLLLACKPEPKIKSIEEVAIIPQPASQALGDGYYIIDKETELILIGDENKVKPVAKYLNETLIKTSDFKLKSIVSDASVDPNNSLVLELTGKISEEESYELISSQSGIKIKSNSPAGLFYGVQTLRQLMPTRLTTTKTQPDIHVVVPSVTIKDEPRFGWRGFMLDVSRHFYGKEEVKRVLDFMAEIKLNRFHWHLADDQGWRLQIKNYPKLTSVGAWRVDYNTHDENVSNWWGRPAQRKGDEATYGGFYTQADIREIVAYAKERFIEVIPEIDMPGHSQAAIAAYPEISCTGGPFYVATGGVFKDNTYCPGKEVTFKFVEDILTEVMDLFPFEYIHIGGDECNKLSWEVDPDCQQRIKDEGLADENELQSYFIKRVEKMINARGKNMIGWDEILEGGLAPNATVMSWRGEKGGIASARAGHDVIMTPSKYCYLDLKQGHDDLEPNLGYSYSFMKDAYEYKIISDSLTEDQGKHVLGVQGNLWTESLADWDKLTYMAFPRMHAIAENAWTAESSKSWKGFANRLQSQFKRLDAQGERYATSAFNVWIDHKGSDKSIDVSLKTEVEGLDIYYTLDGSEPNKNSTKYESEFAINKTATLKATSFSKGEQVGNVSEKYFPIHKGVGAKVIYRTPYDKGKSAGGQNALIDLNYGMLTQGDAAWQQFNGDIEVDLVFSEAIEVEKLEMTTLRFTISGTYPPEYVTVLGSVDGKSYKTLGKTNQLLESHIQGRNKVLTTVNFQKTQLKSIRVIAKSINPIPEGHHKVGTASRIMVDEVVVY